jgi:hypothetical protein
MPQLRLGRRICAALILVVAASCGGGGGSGPGSGSGATPPPSAFSYPTPPIYSVGAAIAPLSPAITGVVINYSVSPALPPGLAIDAVSGKITGTPTAAQPATSYTITAKNSGGSVAFSVSIAIVTVTALLAGKLALSRSRILYIGGQQTQSPTGQSSPGTLTAINVN